MSTKAMITDDPMKAAEQAKHRKEETEARDRVKARKERTKRLIVTGAVLEKVAPQVTGMAPGELEQFLRECLRCVEGPVL